MIIGIQSSAHFQITVPKLEQAIDFFTLHFDAKTIGTAKDFASEDDWMQVHLGVPKESVIEKGVMIQLFDGSILEIFQYNSPNQNQNYPLNSDIGGHHLAFYVKNIEEAVAYLKKHKVKVLGEPTFNQADTSNITGSFENIKWVYFQTDWGLTMELVEQM